MVSVGENVDEGCLQNKYCSILWQSITRRNQTRDKRALNVKAIWAFKEVSASAHPVCGSQTKTGSKTHYSTTVYYSIWQYIVLLDYINMKWMDRKARKINANEVNWHVNGSEIMQTSLNCFIMQFYSNVLTHSLTASCE